MARKTPRIQKVVFLSRIDFGSPGYRQGMVDSAPIITREENASFAVIAGGLISYPHLKRRFPKGKGAAEGRTQVIGEIARELSEALPRLMNAQGKPVKIYIVTAPAVNYDGPIGAEVASRLSELRRNDIVFWGQESARFPLKGLKNNEGAERDFWVVLPTKAAWRSRYFSTRVDRLVQDKAKQSHHEDLPGLWVVDCSAVSIVRPAGELARPLISLPACHRLQEVTTAENQEGIRVVEFVADHEQPIVKTYNLKDLAARERSFIAVPECADAVQAGVLNALRKHPCTIGMLEEELGKRRTTIIRALAAYEKAGCKPPITLDASSGKYDFDAGWLERQLSYPLPAQECAFDRLLNFGCLHAGYTSTQYRFFVETVPELILERGITGLVGAGDFIAGLKHNLQGRGEIHHRMGTYTRQEWLAAELVADVMLRVFRPRFDGLMKRKSTNEKRIRDAINQALLDFYFFLGNHDKWVLDFSVEALATFTPRLVASVTRGIREHIRSRGFRTNEIDEIVLQHVRFGDEHVLPSGLGLAIQHPEMARAATSSLRAQHTLAKKGKAHVVVLANFHVAIEVLEWTQAMGQRVGHQVGTIVSGTEFEDGKLKTVDTSVGILSVGSVDGRIFQTETVFIGPRELASSEENAAYLDELLPGYGLA